MIRHARRAIVIALVSATVGPFGCSHDDEATKQPAPRVLGARPPLPVRVAPAATDDNVESPAGTAESSHALIETQPQKPLTYTVTIKPEAGPKEDPDEAVLAGARATAGACFTNISDGTTVRTATIRVVVLPSGSVSRTEVSAPTTHESWIVSCLEGVGAGLHFAAKPDSDIRNYSINVVASRGR